MKHLHAKDLIVNLEKRNEKMKESYERVLELCYRHIENCSNFNAVACFYEIPEFLMGYPLFNLNECILYVYKQLISNDFNVSYIFPRILFVSWFKPSNNTNYLLENKKSKQRQNKTRITTKPKSSGKLVLNIS